MNPLTSQPRLAQLYPNERKKISVVNPFDQQAFQELDLAVEQDIEQALETAYQAFKDRRQWLSVEQRNAILIDTARYIEENLEEFINELAREGGKPYSDATIEVKRAIDGLRNCAELARDSSHPKATPMDINAASAYRVSFATREPIGVVVALSAFNHPLNLAVHQIGPALAAGCPFIIKPASHTPCSAYRLLDAFHAHGLPKTLGQALVTNDTNLGQKLACDPRVGFLSFIGSAPVGWMLRSKLAPGTRCALEHGGVAPVIVDKSIDIDKTAKLLAKGAFYHAGQVCISVQRIYAHQDIAQDLAKAIAHHGAQMPVGSQLDKSTAIGPLISPKEVDRIDTWVKQAVAGGANLLSGGKRLSETCYPATILSQVAINCELAQKEVFGPVAYVNSFTDVDQALAQANSLDFKFQAAVFSDNLNFALYCYRRLDASCVMINDHSAFRVDWMPFAGLAQSGYGVGGISHTWEEMSINKLSIIHSPSL